MYKRIVLPSLTNHLPLKTLPTGYWSHLSSLELADPEFNIPKPIDALLGVHIYHDILKPGLILGIHVKELKPLNKPFSVGVCLEPQVAINHLMKLQPYMHQTSLPSWKETLQKFWQYFQNQPKEQSVLRISQNIA